MVRGSPARYYILLFPCLVMIALSTAALEVSLQVPLKYEIRTDERGYFPHGYQSGEVKLVKPEGKWILPDLVAAKPAYTTVTLGDNEYLLVFDTRNRSDRFYNRLYFDANANRDLNDDPVITATMTPEAADSDAFFARFQPIEITVAVGEARLPYRFIPTLYCFLGDRSKAPTEEPNLRNMHFNMQTACAYRSSLTLDGTAYDIWLGDSNGNGNFQDQFKIVNLARPEGRVYATGDTLYVLKAGEPLSYESGQILGDHLVLRDRVFRVAVNVAEGKMDLTPVTENLATLKTPAKLDYLELYTEDGSKAVMLFDPVREARLPASRYRLSTYRLQVSDEQGDRWALRAMGGSKGPVLFADAGRTVSITLGEPFSPVVEVSEHSRQDVLRGASTVSLEFYVRGAGDEYVVDLRRVSGHSSKIAMSSKNTSLPAEPTYKVVNDEGEVVTSGKFEYG